jgi:hypothetical protein
MRTGLTILILIGLLAAATGAQAISNNVALGKTVMPFGSFGVPWSVIQTVTDGAWLPDGSNWQSAAWWNGTASYMTINLGGQFTITGFSVQADNNDTYRISYLNEAGGGTSAWEVPTRYNYGGMSTRPNPGEIWSITPITTTALRFQATGGDNMYSVSELQAYGSASQVPEPAAIVLAITGLGTLLSVRRRKA